MNETTQARTLERTVETREGGFRRSVLAAAICVGAIFAGAIFPGAFSTAAAAETSPLLADLTGTWEGSLTYRDYQSDRRVQLPTRIDAQMSAAGDALVMEMAFTDPGYVVRSLDVLTVSPDEKTLRSASVSNGQIETEDWVITEWMAKPDGWQCVLERDGMDDGRPARLRTTRELTGNTLRSLKEVRLTDQPDQEWAFRNELEVERTSPRTEDLVGRWKVDLRPTPDAEAYYQDMIIERQEDGLGVTFYSTPAEDVEVNVDWGQVAFAFRTADGSGGYFTSGRLVGDRIEGQTHAVGRGFFSLWTAERVD